MTGDEWWDRNRKARKTTVLKDFLFAWWVENAGMCVVLPPKKSPCPLCNGKGYVQQMVTSAQGNYPYYDRCGTCHTALHFRVVQWR